jgi:transposase
MGAQDLIYLEELRSITESKKIFVRYSIAIMKIKGYSNYQIADSLGISERTVSRANKAYLEKGIEELSIYKYEGRISKLNESQLKELESHIKIHLYVSAREIIEYVERTYKITLTTSGMRKVLKRISFVYKKTKLIPGKADPIAQGLMRVEIEKVLTEKSPSSHVFFMDGTHPTHNTESCYGWIKRGEEYNMPSNTGRKRVNINGLMNGRNPEEMYIDYTDSVNAQSTIRVLEMLLRSKTDTKQILIYTDNARYYKCKVLQEWLNKHKRIEIKYLPPYSPNLNLIERMWGFMKRKILKGYYYEKYSNFELAIKSFFENLSLYKSELKTLFTPKLQTLDLS